MSLNTVTGPAIEPLTTTEAKKQVRMGSSAGEPKPSAPTIALASPAAPGNVDNGAHRVAVTFVTADGETDVGELSAAVTVADKNVNGQIAVTDIPLGGSYVTSRRLWMTTAGGSTPKLAATIGNNTATTATINVADASLGADAPSTNTTANPELLDWIQSAREAAEAYLRRRLITQTVDWKFDRFPADRCPLFLPLGSVQTITSITYLDDAGVTQTWPVAEYLKDLPVGAHATTGRITPAYGYHWPTTYPVMNAVTVRMVVGYGDSRNDVPAAIKRGMKALLGHWDRSREAVVVGTIASELPFGVKWSWKPFRVVVRESW